MTDTVSLFKDNGDLKTYKEFILDAEELYESLIEEVSELDKEADAYVKYADVDRTIDPEVVLTSFDFERRSIFIFEEIDQSHAGSVFEIIRFWNRIDNENKVPEKDREPIKIYINTPGGDLDAVLSIVDSIKLSKTPVHTITIGTGFSGGFFIGICGHKRFGYPNSTFLFHEGCVMDGGDAHKFLQSTEFYKNKLNKLKKITILNTRITESEYEAYKKDDWYFDADEALKYGLIDEILTELN